MKLKLPLLLIATAAEFAAKLLLRLTPAPAEMVGNSAARSWRTKAHAA